VNNPKYINMSDAELTAHIALVARNLWACGDAYHRINELKEATEELDLRVNRS
jgi:hypothetical protein